MIQTRNNEGVLEDLESVARSQRKLIIDEKDTFYQVIIDGKTESTVGDRFEYAVLLKLTMEFISGRFQAGDVSDAEDHLSFYIEHTINEMGGGIKEDADKFRKALDKVDARKEISILRNGPIWKKFDEPQMAYLDDPLALSELAIDSGEI